MFPVPRNFICFPVLHFGHLIPCSPEINVILRYRHILGESKQTVLLVYVPVNSKTTMYHTRIWLTDKFNTPALGEIEMVQCRAMHSARFYTFTYRDLSRVFTAKMPRSAGHLLGFASRKTKIPGIPQAPRRHGYKLPVHNTSQSEYYKGAARPVLRWRKANVGLGHVTRKYSVKPPQTWKP